MRQKINIPAVLALLLAVMLPYGPGTEPLNFAYWNARYKIGEKSVPADVVIIDTDPARSANANGLANTAKLLDALREAEPRAILLDIPSSATAANSEMPQFAEAVRRLDKKIALVSRVPLQAGNLLSEIEVPDTPLPQNASIVVSAWHANFLGYGEWSDEIVEADGKAYPSAALRASGANATGRETYPDYTLDIDGIPRFSAVDALSGAIPPAALAGKRIFVSDLDPRSNAQIGFLGEGPRVPSVYLDIAGAQGIRSGGYVWLGIWPVLGLVAVMLLLGHRSRGWRRKVPIYGSLVVACIALPALLRSYGVVLAVDAAFSAMAIYALIRIVQRFKEGMAKRARRSSLPSVGVLTSEGIPLNKDVMVAVVGRYEQILASLPDRLHGECARQVAHRLAAASGNSIVYDGENGYFAWLEQARPLEQQLDHLEGLRALFSTPLNIDGYTLDTNVHFGLDRNVDQASSTRVNSAMASATEALTSDRLAVEFEGHRLAQSGWELSIHARIEEALKNGDIWLAYQPQLHIPSGRVRAAEILIRWTDPVRGQISPDEFILQAERAGRIDAITFWVIEQAMLASAAIERQAYPVKLGVNLSARLVDKGSLVDSISALVQRHNFDCSKMTLEVTETFGMRNREGARANLEALQAMGFGISIDDFGTGEAGLAYLAEMPCTEIKLDRRFIGRIAAKGRDFAISRSVIELAHSLGIEVVAEGIEDQETLSVLKDLNCDIGQGYFIGRPVPFATFCATFQHHSIAGGH